MTAARLERAGLLSRTAYTVANRLYSVVKVLATDVVPSLDQILYRRGQTVKVDGWTKWHNTAAGCSGSNGFGVLISAANVID